MERENIHRNGLSYAAALHKLLFLIQASETLQLSGVQLKDETTDVLNLSVAE